MTLARPAFERRVLSVLDASPGQIPVLLGGCGTGRTYLLQRLHQRFGPASCQYIDVERCATTPERFLRAIVAASPLIAPDVALEASSPRRAFDATLDFFRGATASDGAAGTFLLDEVLEIRTFENFPGLRHVLSDLVEGLTASRNRFVVTTRFVTRARRLLASASPRLEVVQLTPLTADEIRDLFAGTRVPGSGDLADIARAVHALSEGHAGYAQAIFDAMADLDRRGGSDPVSALAALLQPGGDLSREITYSYELRLHRARGYGALKGILDILADTEPLTLTEIAHRLQRTPGSTKDYLSWLEDVDLIASRQKRYSFTDPLMRLWVRLHCHPMPPSEEDVAREVHHYALARLPHPEPALVAAGRPADEERKPWGIIEID
jgi:hypothetical protein